MNVCVLTQYDTVINIIIITNATNIRPLKLVQIVMLTLFPFVTNGKIMRQSTLSALSNYSIEGKPIYGMVVPVFWPLLVALVVSYR